MSASRFAAGTLAALVALGPAAMPAPTPAADAPVRSWEFVDGPYVATATVRVGGALRDGADARFTVEKGGLVTVSVQVCGPSAECANGGPAPATSPIGTASEPSGLKVSAQLLFDAGSFTEVGGGFTGEQTVGPFDTVTWSWTLRAAGSGDHVIAVQVAARPVTDLASVDGQTVEMAVQVVPTVRDFLTRRAYSVGPAVGSGLAVVALITLGVVLVIRRRRMREG